MLWWASRAAWRHVSAVAVARGHGVQNLSGEGIRVNVACPTYTDTPLLRSGMAQSELFQMGVEAQGIITFAAAIARRTHARSVDLVVEGLLRLVADDSKAGQVMRITREKGIDFQPFARALYQKSKL